MVHQHFRLVEPFTVAENVVLGDQRRPPARARPRARSSGASPSSASATASPSIRARASGSSRSASSSASRSSRRCYRDARMLILDEPTAVLTPAGGATRCSRRCARWRPRGATVVFISHKLHEVLERLRPRHRAARRARRRDGRDAPARRPRALAALMVGREVETGAGEPTRAARPASARARGARPLRRGRPRRGRALRGVVARGARPARSSASPASRATASASSPRRSPACGRRRARRASSVGGQHAARAATRATRSRAASPTCPRTGSAPGVAPSLSIASNTVLKAYRDRDVSAGPFLRRAAIRAARASS